MDKVIIGLVASLHILYDLAIIQKELFSKELG